MINPFNVINNTMAYSGVVIVPPVVVDTSVPPTNLDYFTGDPTALLLPDTVTTVDIKVGDQYEGKVPHLPGNKHVVQSVPTGMAIGLDTGTIRWTPTPDQVGTFQCSFTAAGATRVITFNVAANASFVMPNATTSGFISNNADPKGTGEYNNPAPDFTAFRTSKTDNKCTKRVIYLRGGTYPISAAHEGELTIANTGFPSIGIFGTASDPVEIKPWGNERVKFRGNGSTILRFTKADYITVNGIEVQGDSKFAKFEDVIKDWWAGSPKYNGNGFAIAGKNVTVKNCVVHEVMTQAIAFKEATNCVVENNIVANSARWTIAGTTGIGMVSMTPSTDPVTTQSNIVRENLLYGVESRIYSRVFSKKSAHLDIDEGEQILFQPTNITGQGTVGYQGRYLAENNLMMHGGKGIVANTSDNCDILNNTLYNMGSTMGTVSAGLRSNKSSNSTWKRNLVSVVNNPSNPQLEQKQCVSFSDNSYVAIPPVLEDNYVMEDNSPVATRLSGVNYVSDVFENLANNNPKKHSSIPANIGAPDSVYSTLFPKAQSYSVNVTPDPYYLTIDYGKITKGIIDNIPSYLSADFSNWHDTLPYTDGNGIVHNEFTVPITGDLSKLDGSPSTLELIVVHTYTR